MLFGKEDMMHGHVICCQRKMVTNTTTKPMFHFYLKVSRLNMVVKRIEDDEYYFSAGLAGTLTD